MILLPLRFEDKGKAKNLEDDFLVVDVPMAHNVVLGQLTLHKSTNDCKIDTKTCAQMTTSETTSEEVNGKPKDFLEYERKSTNTIWIKKLKIKSSMKYTSSRFLPLARAWRRSAMYLTYAAKSPKQKNDPKKNMSKERHSFTSTMATCSSVTLGVSEEREGAKSHDLARCSMRADLAKGSASKKCMA
ncbi:hypothetical protein Cgig2_028798 [Carnegiea gigantea]|uniref:Uncharacterized protein n=1 Tax=Carnegiea gigantea TaxID=171969 RepID=A0A9Q1GK50_9CARY|nr:hypothetical protein Cgig2_028798 [Carnegiea gigantea]